MLRLFEDDGPDGGDELMSSKTGLSMEYVAAVVLFDGDFDRFIFVIRFIRLTAVDDVTLSLLSLLLLDDCEPASTTFGKILVVRENSINYSPVTVVGSLFLLKKVSTLPIGLDHTVPY